MWKQDLSENSGVVLEHVEYIQPCRAERTIPRGQTYFDMSVQKLEVRNFQSTCASLPATIRKKHLTLSTDRCAIRNHKLSVLPSGYMWEYRSSDHAPTPGDS